MLNGVVIVLFFAVGLGSAIYGFTRTRKDWDRALQQANALLQGPRTIGRGTVTGKLAEHDVVIELTTRGDGDSTKRWTEIRVERRDVPMSLALRPQTLVEAAVVAMSKAVDVIVGDEVVDRAFVIDGAPADAVRRVLEDAPLRQRLLSLLPVEVEEKGSALQIAKQGWIVDELETMLLTIVTLVTRMETLSGTKGPYRDTELTHVKADLSALALARARRLRLRNGLLVAFVVAFIAVFAFLTTRRG